MPKPTYEVLTWDMDKQTFTPQQGVRKGPYTLWKLRTALRKLRSMGYETTKAGGVSVLIQRRESETAEEMLQHIGPPSWLERNEE
jgi:hypothetical protein